MPAAEVFKTIVAGLADDPNLLDLNMPAPAPESSELDLSDLYEPEPFEPEPSGLHEDSAALDPHPDPSWRGEWK